MGRLFVEVFPNGLTLLGEVLPHTRAAAFEWLFPTGVASDPEGLEGVSRLLHGLCFRGAGELDSRALSDALDSLGLQRGGSAGIETSTFNGALLAENLPAVLRLYADILRRPWLPEEELEAERSLALQELRSIEEHPPQKLFQELRRTYFPGPHGRPPVGSQEGLQRATAEDLRAEHQRRYRPGGAILAVAGGFDWEQVRDTVGECFGDWEGTIPPLPSPQPENSQRYRHVEQEAAQEQIGVAYPEVPADHPEFYAARMAIQVLSGGMSARLFTEVRERRGLVYAVHAGYHTLRGAGYVTAYAGTTPERSQETLEVLLRELKRLPEGIGEDELERGRAGLLSSLVMAQESSSARAAALAADWFLRGRVRPLEEIRAAIEGLKVSDVLEHLRAHPPQEFTIVTLGPRTLTIPP